MNCWCYVLMTNLLCRNNSSVWKIWKINTMPAENCWYRKDIYLNEINIKYWQRQLGNTVADNILFYMIKQRCLSWLYAKYWSKSHRWGNLLFPLLKNKYIKLHVTSFSIFARTLQLCCVSTIHNWKVYQVSKHGKMVHM